MKIIRPVAVAQTGTLTRASTGTYWDKNGVLQTAVANALRITYDPSDLKKAPYALVEPAATNLFLNSGNMSVQSLGANMTYVGTTDGPAGQTGYRFTSKMNGNSYVLQSIATGASTRYTYSYWLRLPSGIQQGTFYAKDSANPAITYPISVVNTTAWQKVSVTFTTTATAGATVFHIGAVDSPAGYTFDIAMAQVETGSSATSYIPTTSTAATRAADTLSGTGLLYSSLAENDYSTWNSTTLYTTGTNVLDLATRSVYQSITGVPGTSTFTAASAGNVTMLKSDGTAYVPAVNTPVVFTGATMPTGITSGVVYYVQATTATAFSVAATKGGAAITTGALATATATVASNNYNMPVSNTTNWLNIGYDNRWGMFDQSITSQSTSNTTITVAILPGQRMDSIVGLNVSATRAKVSLVDTGSGVVAYSANVNLTASSGITDLYSYFYEPIVRLPDFVLDDLPVGPSASGVLVVSFEDANTAKVGGLVLGLSKEIGTTSSSAKVGIIDYSVKTQDAFGNYTITPRAFSKKADFTVQLPSQTVDFVFNLLATYRSTPIVYIGSNSSNDADQYNATVVYGFYKDMSIEIAYKTVSMCTLSVEGLT